MQRLSAASGLPFDVVQRNVAQVKRQMQINDDVTRVSRLSPMLKQQLQDPFFAAIAHDDIDNLSQTEHLIKSWDGPKPSIGSVATGLLDNLSPKPVLSALKLAMHDAFASDDSIESQVYRQDLQRKALQDQAQRDNLTPDFQSSTAGAIYSGGASFMQALPGLALSIATGNPVPSLALAGVNQGAPAYPKYLDRGASKAEAALGALGEGATEIGFEALPMGYVINKFGKAGAGEFLTGLAARELPTEQATTLVQDAIDTAIANPDKTWGDYWAERPEAAYQTLVATLTQGGVMGGIHAAARRLSEDAQQAETAQQVTGFFERLNQLATVSKVNTRNPGAMKSFVDTLIKDTGAENVYIDAHSFAQSGIAEKVSTILPEIAAQLPEALATGGEVRIPVSDYFTKIAGTEYAQPLLEHVRVEGQEASLFETNQFKSGPAGERLAQDFEHAMTQQQADESFQASALAVKDIIKQQLDSAGRYTSKANEKMAIFASSRYAVLADALGKTPEEMFKQYPMNIAAMGSGRQSVFNQAEKTAMDVTGRWQKALRNRTPATRDKPLYFDTPTVLKQFGVKEKITPVPSRVLMQILSKHPDVPKSVFANLPTLLADPTYIFPHKDGGVSVAIDAQTEKGEPIIVGVRDGRVRTITPLHHSEKMTGTERLLAAFQNSSGSVYARNEKALAEAKAFNPVAGWDNSKGHNVRSRKSIVTRDDLVKQFGENFYQGGLPVYHQRSGVKRDDYTVDLFGVPAETGQPVQAETQDAGRLSRDDAPAGTYATKTQIVQETTRELGADQVNTPEQAAQALAYLSKNATERFEALVTDKDGKPLAIVGSFKGAMDGSHAFVPTVTGEAFRIEGAANIWFAHNHPSGITEFSDADRAIYQKLENVFRGSEIMPRGFFAIGGKQGAGQSYVYSDDTAGDTTKDVHGITKKAKQHITPVVERVYSESGKLAEAINSPEKAKAVAAELSNGESGVMLMDNQHAPVAFIPVKSAESETLRTDGRMDALHRGLSMSNAAAAIIVNQGDMTNNALMNLAGFFNNNEVRVLDVLDKNGERMDSRAEAGLSFSRDVFYQSARVDQQIKQWAEGKLSGSTIIDIGRPLAILQKFGMDDLPIRLTQGVLKKAVNKHNVKAEDLQGLAAAIQSPLAIFASKKGAGHFVVLTELTHSDGNIIAALDLNAKRRDIEVHDIRSLHPKTNNNVMNWVEDGLLLGYEKTNGLAWLEGNSQSHSGRIQVNEAIAKASVYDASEISKLFQGAGDQRGAFNPLTRTITLMDKADLSTFLHEAGHFFLEMQMDLASNLHKEDDLVGTTSAQKQLMADTEILLKWFGVKSLEEWNSLDFEQKRPYHEQFAQGAEKYFYEGNAPSLELARIFASFRQWMMKVYEHLKDHFKDVELTDEVRQVFDRMLATDAEIKHAQESRSMMPLFADQEKSGMTPEEWADYQAEHREATSTAMEQLALKGVRDMQWLHNARNRKLKELQKQHKALRREVRGEVEAEVMAQPIYQAWKFLTSKLNIDDLPAARIDLHDLQSMPGLDDAIIQRLIDLKMTAKEGGLHPDMITDKVPGFSSGDALVKALAAAPKPNDEIERLTDDRMLQNYGELSTPEAIQRAADAAIHNEARARFITTEANALAKATGSLRILNNAAKEYAEKAIAKLEVRNINPGQYARAEARAAKAAADAERAGKIDIAAAEKRNQVLNHYLAKAAYDAQDEIASIVKYGKKFYGKPKKRAPEYLEQIIGLLDHVNLRQVSNKQLDEVRAQQRSPNYTAWVKQRLEDGQLPYIAPNLLNAQALSRYLSSIEYRNAQGELVFVDDDEAITLLAAALDQAQPRNYKEMPLEELRGLRDTIENIEHLGREQDRYYSDNLKRGLAERRLDMALGINTHSNGKGGKNVRTANHPLGKAQQGIASIGVSHITVPTWVRIMDGGVDNGPLFRNLLLPGNRQSTWEVSRKAHDIEALDHILRPIMAKVPLTDKHWKGITFDNINGVSLNWKERFGMLLNVGNESNMQRLMGSGIASVTPTLSPEQILSVLKTFNEDELLAAQAIWDHFESYWPEIEAKEKRVSGRAPEKIPIRPITITSKDGKPVTLRGGYYPVVFDTKTSGQAKENEKSTVLKAEAMAARSNATTRRSFTKQRVDAVFNRPLLINLDGIYRGVNDVIHDLAWHEWIMDANRLLRAGQPLEQTMREHYGDNVYNQFIKWKNDLVAGQHRLDHAAEKVSSYLRRNVSASVMLFNAASALKQPLGFFNSGAIIGKKWLARGLAKYVANPFKATEEALELSEFLRNRNRTQFRELHELRNMVESTSGYNEFIGKYGFWMMTKMQQTVDVPTWWGAYEKALARDPADYELAVSIADQAVKNSQGGGEEIDLSGVERGPHVVKMLTVLYRFMNTTLNVLYGTYKINANKSRGQKDTASVAATFLMLAVVAPQLEALLTDLLKPGDDDDDDDPYLAFLRTEWRFSAGLFIGLRELSDLGNRYGRGYEGPLGYAAIGKTRDFLEQLPKAVQGDFDRAFRKAFVNEMGLVAPVPTGAINRTWDGAEALIEGKTENPAALVFGFRK